MWPWFTSRTPGAKEAAEAHVSEARALYLDLMQKTLANTIYGDPDQAPWGKGTYDQSRRQSGRDWPAMAHSMIGLQRLQNLRELCERVLNEGTAGDFIETGVWRGGACIMMRAVLKAYGVRSRKVFCADSFEGLPAPDPRYPKDEGDRHHEFKQLAISVDEVGNNFRAYDLLDDQVVFVKGLFKDTLPALSADRFALIRLDGDMYESTISALESLYDRVSRGGYVIVDDYGAISACKAAVEDFRQTRSIQTPMQTIDWTGVWWRKEQG
jgi:hypothetical protein